MRGVHLTTVPGVTSAPIAPSEPAGDCSANLGNHHFCVLHEGGEGLSDSCAGLVRKAVAAGFAWICVLQDGASKNFGTKFDNSMRADGTIVDADELLKFRFSPICISTVTEKLREFAERARIEGYTGLLILFDMSWMLEAPSGLANHGELEAALHDLTASASIWIACIYDRMIYPPSILLDVLRTHAKVLHADAVYVNPHFLPPPVFLSGDAERKLEWWLARLPGLSGESAGEAGSADWRHTSVSTSASCGIEPDAGRDRFQKNCTNPHRANTARGERATERWKIRCLGELRVYRHDGSLVEWNRCSGATYKIKTIFAYLLQKGAQGASIEEMADLLWPEANDINQSLNRLYHTIHCLRTSLCPELPSSRACPYMISRNRRYYLSLPEGTWIDVPIFEQFCRQGEKLLKTGDLEQSLVCHLAAERLYSGSLFSDIPIEYVENTERDWCWSQRFWIERIYLKMLTYLAAIYRRRDDSESALRCCERVLKTDPCYETAHQEAMRIYHLIGRADALDRQYRLCRESLKRFEDRQPSTSTVSLAHDLIG